MPGKRKWNEEKDRLSSRAFNTFALEHGNKVSTRLFQFLSSICGLLAKEVNCSLDELFEFHCVSLLPKPRGNLVN